MREGGWTHDAFLCLAWNGFHGRHVDASYAIIGEGEERWGKERIRANICITLCATFVLRPTTTMKARLRAVSVSFVQKVPPRRWHATAVPHDPSTALTPPANATLARTYWSKQEIKSVYDTPLLELVFRAATAHRAHNDPNKIQLCTLMSIKSAHARLPFFRTNPRIQLVAARKIVRPKSKLVHCP